MSNDLLYDCAKAYEKMMDYEFEVELSVNKSIKKFNIIFEPNQFKHLSGLEKLEDKDEFKENDSTELFNKILRKELTISDVMSSDYANVPINQNSSTQTSYYVIDRLKELTYLYENLHNMTAENLHIHLWKKDCNRDMRPNHSQISADYMFEFQNSATRKSATENACAFFIETKERNAKKINNAVGVSIIPTDISYADDGSISVERCLILSVTEIDKNNSRNPINLISAPEELREKAYSDSNSKLQFKKVKQDIADLKKKREKFLLKGDTKSQSLYQSQIDTFKKASKYTIETLKQVLTSLTSQAESQKNPDLKRLIEQEIKVIQGEMASREKNQTSELSSGIKISKSVINGEGTLALNPTVTIEQPKALVESRARIEKQIHLAKSSIDRFFSDIKSALSKLIAKPDKKTPKKKSVQHPEAKHEPYKAAQTVKRDMPDKEPQPEKEPLFSIAQIKSDRYAPTSSKGKDIDRSKNNDLDL